MSRVKNKARRCRICGAKCEKVMRYCVACAIERKAARIGIDPAKVHVGVYVTPPAARAVVEREIAAAVTMNPPLSTGGYLGEMLPALNLSAPSGGAPEARKSRRQQGKPTPANS